MKRDSLAERTQLIRSAEQIADPATTPDAACGCGAPVERPWGLCGDCLAEEPLGARVALPDRFGEPRVHHKTRYGWQRKNTTDTHLMNQAMQSLVTKRMRAMRLSRGWTLLETAKRMNLADGWLKQRAWALENNTRQDGFRLGMIYRIALAFSVEVRDIMPTNAEVADELTRMRGDESDEEAKS